MSPPPNWEGFGGGIAFTFDRLFFPRFVEENYGNPALSHFRIGPSVSENVVIK